MRNYKGEPYREFRCKKCRSLLAFEYIYAGRMSIKCYNCNTMNTFKVKSSKKMLMEQKIKQTALIDSNKEEGGE